MSIIEKNKNELYKLRKKFKVKETKIGVVCKIHVTHFTMINGNVKDGI